ncbi:28 kDa heat- and acid-stable phosphoprotein-like [Panonychus citri]|uniref:28 kDa heat- and acid-stable phosphoprotein-like n=1 Tax=Panonychus citri TaxID=50023 RepID=UPI00230791B5|nr:28 kDa heat- and acid-stable phosphoprotein-like [Panonychus citri]
MGKGKAHKGGRRQFTNPQDMVAKQEKEEKEREWRKRRGEIESSSEDEDDSEEEEETSSEEEEAPGVVARAGGSGEADGSGDANKAVEPLIEVNNPNRAVKKPSKKELDNLVNAKVELSRREREELEKQLAREHYAKLTMEGKTEQAREDLARLAVIKKQREEAAKKREDEKRLKEEAKTKAAADKKVATRSVAASVTVASSSSGEKGKGRKK